MKRFGFVVSRSLGAAAVLVLRPWRPGMKRLRFTTSCRLVGWQGARVLSGPRGVWS